MRYGIVDPAAEPNLIAELAAEAEKAGWDGLFLADAMALSVPGMPPMKWFDSWVALAACAVRTKRIRLGTMLTAVPRHKPWKLAREVGTVDHLSNGRAILAAGIGVAEDDGGFFQVGEAIDMKIRAQIMDESLQIIDGLCSEKPVKFDGLHFHVDNMAMCELTVQKPRVPIWVVGVWPKMKSMRRTLRYDGVIPQRYKAGPEAPPWAPAEIQEMRDWVKKEAPEKKSFDIIVGGSTSAKDKKKAVQKAEPFVDSGATWWLENFYNLFGKSPEEHVKCVRERIQAGPPKSP